MPIGDADSAMVNVVAVDRGVVVVCCAICQYGCPLRAKVNIHLQTRCPVTMMPNGSDQDMGRESECEYGYGWCLYSSEE